MPQTSQPATKNETMKPTKASRVEAEDLRPAGRDGEQRRADDAADREQRDGQAVDQVVDGLKRSSRPAGRKPTSSSPSRTASSVSWSWYGSWNAMPA